MRACSLHPSTPGTPEYPRVRTGSSAVRACVLARCARPPPAAQAVLNRVPPVVLPQQRVLTQYPRVSSQPLRAGLYAWGAKGTNDCAAPSSRIVDAAACASAAAAAGKTYDGVVAEPAYPRGCAWCARRTHADARTHGHFNASARRYAVEILTGYSQVRRQRRLRPPQHGAWRRRAELYAALRAAYPRYSRGTHAVLTPYSRGFSRGTRGGTS